MSKETLIAEATESLKRLPANRIVSVQDYISFLLKKYEEEAFNEGVYQLSAESTSFDFLKDEEDIYTLDDVKVRYHD